MSQNRDGAPQLKNLFLKNAVSSGMKLVWGDEFNRNGAPDPTKWNFEHGFSRNEEAQWYQSDNATVKAGKLIIEARRERKPNPNFKTGSADWRTNRPLIEYTSSSLTSLGKSFGQSAWKYGRFEMRARIDTRLGMWPAFWTVGQNGEWPSGGEIDIMEFYRGKLLANFVWGTNQRWNGKWNAKAKPIKEFGDPDWSNKFHVWAMDWDENRIVLSVDGQVLNTQNLSETINGDAEAKNPFRAPHGVILNLAVGGQNGGDPSQTEFPARFEVDYLRIYQQR
ncbi:glycoside hydrolase family 16 protein [Abditibacterium utsteinense]|uniref:glycoside hydrolase family 16 protein n=1 Tax=Abditibacterium utsteinense TaxID=1960156 RepID=UPI001EE75628|nr:glycoside hydrolase family 16 protein [Abditibacterium utsteinense]